MILKLILQFQLKYIYNTKFLPPALHINASHLYNIYPNLF